MINNYSKPDFNHAVLEWTAEGVGAGIIAFMHHNRVNYRPGDKSKTTLEDFSKILLGEFVGDATYPFKESLKQKVFDYTQQEVEVLKALYDRDDMKNMRGLCHVIGGEAVASFLEDHREQTLKMISEIRGK